MILTALNAKQTLCSMLTSAKLDLVFLPMEPTWTIFSSFCGVPIASSTDGVIVQWGPDKVVSRTLSQPPWFEMTHVGFYFSVLRQFDALDGEEYEQLEVIWHFPRDSVLDDICQQNSGWCFPSEGCDLSSFLNTQRKTELFELLLQRKAVSTEIVQENTG